MGNRAEGVERVQNEEDKWGREILRETGVGNQGGRRIRRGITNKEGGDTTVTLTTVTELQEVTTKSCGIIMQNK